MLARIVSVDVRSASIHEALEQLRAVTGIDFNYENVVVDSISRRVTFRDSQTSLARALAFILRGTGLIATTFDSSIIVKHAAPSVVRGRVVDASSGRPVTHATVLINGLWQHAATTDSGTFRLDSVPDGNFTLEVRILGYRPEIREVSVVPSSHLAVELSLESFIASLDRVVVTSTVVPTPVKELPVPISVITSADFQEQHYSRVDDIFRGRVPGSIAWEQGNFDYYSTITVRGINSLQVNAIKTYIDGVEVADYTFAAVDPNSIDRIEVIRGPEASTIYGSDASGGVMQIFTKHGVGAPDRPVLRASATEGIVQGLAGASSRAALQQDYALGVSGSLVSTATGDKASYDVGTSYRHVGAWIPGYYSSDPGAYGGLRIDHGPLSISVSGRYLQRDLPLVISPALVATNIAALSTPQNTTEQEHEQTYGVNLAYAPNPWWRHSLTVGYDRSEFEEVRNAEQLPDSGLALVDQQTGKASIAYNTSVSVGLGRSVHTTATIGLDHYDRTFNTASASHLPSIVGLVADTLGVLQREPVSNTGFFAQVQLSILDQLFITAGGRADNNSGIGPSYGYAWAPRVGLSYVRSWNAITLKARAAYGQGIEPGLPSERQGQHLSFLTQLPNNALAPERQVGGDLGLDLAFGRTWSLSATYYNQQARDLIQQVLLGSDSVGLTLQYQNVAQINNRGFELQASLALEPVRLDAEFSYTSSRIARLPPLSEYSGDYRVGDQALQVPLTSGGATLSSRLWRDATLAASMTYVGYWTSYSYPELDGAIYGQQPLMPTRSYWMRFPAFAKFRLSIDQRLRGAFDLFLMIDNLSNSHVTEQNGNFVSPGRTTAVGIRLNN